jgi:hypothetical protein
MVKGAAIWFVFQISAQTLAILTDMFWEFLQSNQANAVTVRQTHPWPFPSTSSFDSFLTNHQSFNKADIKTLNSSVVKTKEVS